MVKPTLLDDPLLADLEWHRRLMADAQTRYEAAFREYGDAALNLASAQMSVAWAEAMVSSKLHGELRQ